MKNVRPPQFLGNLYRDMRDRHLLIPAVALVVALLAVPVLLKSHSSATTPAVAVGNATKSDSAAVPAVVTQQLAGTQYQKRLDRLTSKNPFHQQFTTPPASARVHVTSSGTGASTSTSSTATSPSTGTGSLSASSPTSSTLSTGGTSSPPVSATSPSTGSSLPATTHTKPTSHLYTYRVAVKVGEPGKLADRPEVASLALLPSKSRPILTFLEANGKRALFLVSTDVDSVKGDGRCVPRPADCQYVVMRAGDKASFHYAPSNKRFNLVLKDIHVVEIGHKLPAKVSKGNADLKPKLPLLGQG
jgi:hypothetical protein